MTLLRCRHAASALRRRFPRWVLPIVGVVCALPLAARADQSAETRLIKPLREEVKIHWQAQVLEPGGAFILYRGQGTELEEVARLAADGGGDYEIVDRAWSGGRSIYQLRYRDSDRTEHVLMTSAVHLEVVESSAAAGWLASQAQPMTLPSAMRILAPSFAGPRPFAGPAPVGDSDREPPTPPPQRRAA